MRNNTRSLDGTPLQRVTRRPPPAPSAFFNDEEIAHITAPSPRLREIITARGRAVAAIATSGARTTARFFQSYFPSLRAAINRLLTKTHLQQRIRRRPLIIGLACLAILLVYLSTIPTKKPSTPSAQPHPASSKPTPQTLAKGAPPYPTLTPNGVTADQLGGWTRVSPPSADAVYAYADRIDTVPIIVSQQPLPKAFLDDTTSKIKDLATNYAATEHLTIDGIDVYIGKAASGQQSVVLSKQRLLILIKTNTAVDHGKLLQYIHSLR